MDTVYRYISICCSFLLMHDGLSMYAGHTQSQSHEGDEIKHSHYDLCASRQRSRPCGRIYASRSSGTFAASLSLLSPARCRANLDLSRNQAP